MRTGSSGCAHSRGYTRRTRRRRARPASPVRRFTTTCWPWSTKGPRDRHEFTATAPNQVWLTDITEHPTHEGKLYLCAIKDYYYNKIVGYSIDSRMKSSLAARRAAQRDRLAITGRHHMSIRQGQSVQIEEGHADPEKNDGLHDSMGRVAAAGDNAAIESFFSLLQKNVLDTKR